MLPYKLIYNCHLGQDIGLLCLFMAILEVIHHFISESSDTHCPNWRYGFLAPGQILTLHTPILNSAQNLQAIKSQV